MAISQKKSQSKKRKRTKSSGFSSITKQYLPKLMANLKSDRAIIIYGLSCWLLAIYLCIAFSSYIISTWGSDHSYVQHITLADVFTDTDINTQNWLGRLGSYMAHLFFYRWFGFSSFIVVLTLVLTANKLLFKKVSYSLSKVYRYATISIFLTASILGFLFSGSSFTFPYGGGLGKYVNDFLMSLLGFIGTAILLLFCLALVLILIFNVQLDFDALTKMKWKFSWQKPTFSGLFGREENNINNSTNNTTKQKPQHTPTPQPETLEQVNLGQGEQIELDFKQKLAKKQKKKDKQQEQGDMLLEVVPTKREETDLEKEDRTNTKEGKEEYDPRLDLSHYKFPTINLLKKYGRDLYEADVLAVSREELEQNKVQIVETLGNYNIEIAKISATPGPTVTLYEIVPAPGIRISRIRNLEDDIALSLAALGIRIIAPMPGKGTIGIEVPNQKKEIVSLRSLIVSEKFSTTKMRLPVALGKTISDENFIADLSKMPHLLLAGATGQGKSVCLNSILISLLYKKHPAELKFVMIDPKKVELALYNLIDKHFLAKLPGEEEAIVTDIKKVVNTLNALCIEMDQRYDLLKRAYVRNVAEYNAKFKQRKLNPLKGHRFLPYIVLVIDEFADLIMTAGKEVELPLARLAQLARAIGIHLVIATQRPTVNIITGTIKANFPCRIAFRVTSKVDSRTILDQGGANQLIGRGDMLLSIGGDVVRLQGAFVDTPEVEDIAKFIGEQMGYPEAFLLPEYRDDDDVKIGDGSIEMDDLFEDAAHIIVQHQQGSTSLLQRRLKLGYNRAGRIMDQLEAMGIVGPNVGSKAREVYITDAFALEQFLEQLKEQ